MMQSLENSLEKSLIDSKSGFEYIHKRLDELSGHREKVETHDKRLDILEKTVSKHQNSITKLDYESDQKSLTKTSLTNPAIITFITILISAIIGGTIGYKGTSTNDDNGSYHAHATHTLSRQD
jgi:hypothetical protein